MGSDNIPYQSIPAPLLYYVARACCKKCVQCSYAREEDFNLVSDGDSFLQIWPSEKSRKQGIVNELRD